MPKKTDGIPFTLQPRPTKGDDGKPLLYAQPVIEHKYTIDDIDSLCTGDHPRLRRYREGRVWHYTFLETSPTV